MAMMTGRVLLVCALCVLWCGAGGRCEKVVVGSAAGGGGDVSGGKGAVKNTDTSTSGPDTSDSSIDVSKVNQATEKSEVKSLEGNGDNVDQQDVVVSRVEGEKKKNSSEQLEEPMKDDLGKEKTNPEIKNKEQEGGQPPQAQLNVQQQPQPQTQQSQTQLQQQPHAPASEEGKGVGENNTGGAGQPPLGVEDKGNEDSKALGKGDSLKSPGKESENSERVQTTAPNTVTPEHETQNEMLTPEQKTNESQSTDTSTNLPELQKENKEYPASTEGTARSTSTGSQEQEAEPSTSEEPSPFEEEQSTVTKTTEDARTPDAAATEKRQTVNNEKVGDSDSSTAVSHTTSPLLPLLLVVACAAAAAVVAA
ncbi:Mucin-associated surface protein (MASP) [Trypanosoma cruzi]|uniref:Mucin-associated surface protein (MASP), putative n=2 Tax=Trypanosoma cruzi TaxID=5693 RepID=Q4E522_TRYCC|nr:mucin-associated surface protein (MASP), putative [Trypanosoma cruzi]EAN99850.1 mucin-associated surface protein (MASP), putative [Trypanosoma cruzi]PWV17805.1 Mucin-associated surface protein (MASP) [Trypanosoma cruzi]RNC40556.1 mucin-associated surface protein (MASP) [Trypanosoma cruzi]|eukprot:XP_821701.1 mucin-associated surface protein (MASP) [Trypanosoma cruzi strain CL Brener]